MTLFRFVIQRGLALILLVGACAAPSEDPTPAGPVGEPEFIQEKFKIYTKYRPQIQVRDFNGVFDIGPSEARIVRKFWKERFNELTRPGHYGEFFMEFYEYMSSFAQSYPEETRGKERMLDTLERSFHAFCMTVKVDEPFERFQAEQQRIYGD